MTKTIIERLADDSREAAELLTQGFELLCEALLYIHDPAAKYDYAVAVDELLTAMGGEGDMIADTEPRPEGDRSRPLGERLGDPEVEPHNPAGQIAMILLGMSLAARGIRDTEVRKEVTKVVLAFIAKLKGEDNATVIPPKVPNYKPTEEEGNAA